MAEDLAALQGQVEKLQEELSKLSKLSIKPVTENKTVYISKDRKLQKFSGRPTKDTDPNFEEWVDDVS